MDEPLKLPPQNQEYESGVIGTPFFKTSTEKGEEVLGSGFEPSAAYAIPLTPPFIDREYPSPSSTTANVI